MMLREWLAGLVFCACVGSALLLAPPARADVPKSAVNLCNGIGGGCFGSIAYWGASWVYVCAGSPYESSGRCVGVPVSAAFGITDGNFGCSAALVGSPAGDWGYCGVGTTVDPSYSSGGGDPSPPSGGASAAQLSADDAMALSWRVVEVWAVAAAIGLVIRLVRGHSSASPYEAE